MSIRTLAILCYYRSCPPKDKYPPQHQPTQSEQATWIADHAAKVCEGIARKRYRRDLVTSGQREVDYLSIQMTLAVTPSNWDGSSAYSISHQVER
jgi:hypothetical protein